MARTPIWKSIATTVSDDIGAGLYLPGDKLPTEAQLAARFGVNRHTVRHALGALVEDGIIYTRRGAGAFVAQTPTDYPIGKRVRFHQNIAAAGRNPSRQLLSLEKRLASPEERSELDLNDGALVHVYEGLSFVDTQPIAIFQAIFPAARFPDLPDALRVTGSVTAALKSAGIADYTRASTRLMAKRATATQALHLRIGEGAPILHSVAVSVDGAARPVEYGNAWFAGDRVTLTLGSE